MAYQPKFARKKNRVSPFFVLLGVIVVPISLALTAVLLGKMVQSVGLFGAIPQLDVRVRRLSAIKGLPPDPTKLPEGCHFHPRCPYATEECKCGKIPFQEVRPGHFCRCIHPEAGRTM